jgi:hypothetical protein
MHDEFEDREDSEGITPRDGQTTVEALAELAAKHLESNTVPLISVRAELPSGGTVVLALGMFQAGEWLHNRVHAELRDDDELEGTTTEVELEFDPDEYDDENENPGDPGGTD